MSKFNLPENSKILKGKYFQDSSGSKNLKKVNVYRWNPDDGKNPENASYSNFLSILKV